MNNVEQELEMLHAKAAQVHEMCCRYIYQIEVYKVLRADLRGLQSQIETFEKELKKQYDLAQV
jgi:hypothetical protein